MDFEQWRARNAECNLERALRGTAPYGALVFSVARASAKLHTKGRVLVAC